MAELRLSACLGCLRHASAQHLFTHHSPQQHRIPPFLPSGDRRKAAKKGPDFWPPYATTEAHLNHKKAATIFSGTIFCPDSCSRACDPIKEKKRLKRRTLFTPVSKRLSIDVKPGEKGGCKTLSNERTFVYRGKHSLLAAILRLYRSKSASQAQNCPSLFCRPRPHP